MANGASRAVFDVDIPIASLEHELHVRGTQLFWGYLVTVGHVYKEMCKVGKKGVG